MTTPNVRYRRIYVWELPVRAFHWVNGISVLALLITGYLIGRPFAVAYAQEASFQYWFGTVRFIHFLAAYVFTINFFARLYWGFVGNRYAGWKQFIPTTSKCMKEMADVLRVDILQTRVHGAIHVGHNRLAGTIYFLTFFVFLFQVLTGFALYAPMSNSFLGWLSAWVIPVMGGDFAVRQWHHAMLWFYVLFSMVHIYLVFYHDYVEGRGTTSSMVGGWKFEREDLVDH